jgi:hypothetical protein
MKHEQFGDDMWAGLEDVPFDITEAATSARNAKPGVERARAEKDLTEVVISVLKNQQVPLGELRIRLKGLNLDHIPSGI